MIWEKRMDTKLFVGNLSYNTTEDDLRSLFTQAGTVTSVTVITDRDTGRSKGFAFVEMSSQSEAEQAIKLFNGSMLDNRAVKVDIARPKEDRPFSGSRFDNRSSQGYGRDRSRRSGGGDRSRRY
jgi:RNA recognition motif-containing protein